MTTGLVQESRVLSSDSWQADLSYVLAPCVVHDLIFNGCFSVLNRWLGTVSGVRVLNPMVSSSRSWFGCGAGGSV